MKRILLAVIVSAITLPVFASDDEAKNQEYLDLCKTYAKDDGVAGDELDKYLSDCVKDLQETAADSK